MPLSQLKYSTEWSNPKKGFCAIWNPDHRNTRIRDDKEVDLHSWWNTVADVDVALGCQYRTVHQKLFRWFRKYPISGRSERTNLALAISICRVRYNTGTSPIFSSWRLPPCPLISSTSINRFVGHQLPICLLNFRQLVFYGAYHSNKTNVIIHIICVPLIVWYVSRWSIAYRVTM